MSILLPKTWISTAEIWGPDIYRPLFFLAGPVRGGADWQASMYAKLWRNRWTENCIAAIPCRWGSEHAFAHRFLAGPKTVFARQLAWERHYLELAGLHSKPGCVIFWLACESKDAPHPGPEPYSMDTRRELGEWYMRIKYENARVVIGAEKDFYGLSQIQRSIEDVLGRPFLIHETMDETVRAAVKIVVGS